MGETFNLLSLSAFSGGKALAFNSSSERLHEVHADGSISAPLPDSARCASVARIDGELFACGSLDDVLGTRSQLVDIRDAAMNVRASMYHTSPRERSQMGHLFVASAGERVFVAETQAPQIRVFDVNGKELRSIAMQGPAYRPPTMTLDASRSNFTPWFRSFTPIVSLAAGGGYVGASYRVSPVAVHTVIFRISDGARVHDSARDDAFMLACISADQFIFTDAISQINVYEGRDVTAGGPRAAPPK